MSKLVEIQDYLYSEEFSDLKYKLVIEIIKNHDVFDGYKKTETYKKAYRPFDVGKENKNQILQQFPRIQQLERLQNININNLEITNHDYTHFSYLTNTIIYLDPPYENTTLKSYSISEFNSQPFYDWAYEMSKKNIVLISSYEISDSRFECVYEFKTVKSTFAPSKKSGGRTEKLFMVKK